MGDNDKDVKQLQLQLLVSQRDHLATSQHLMQFQIEALTKSIESLSSEIKSDNDSMESRQDNNDGN